MHSFCNPLVDKYFPQMYEQAECFYKLYEKELNNQHCVSALDYLCEIFTRVCTIKYDVDKYKLQEEKEYMEIEEREGIRNEKEQGFLCIDSLYKYINVYDSLRTFYKTFEEFMPNIVKKFNSLDYKEMYTEFESQRAEILGTSIVNGSDSVDYDLDSIVVKFSIPMSKGSNGMSPDTGCDTCKMPKGIDFQWSTDATKWTVFVELEPSTQYTVYFPAQFFLSKNDNGVGYHPKNTYKLTFKTRSKK